MLRLVGMGAVPAAMMGVSLGLVLQPDYTSRQPMNEIFLSQAVGYEAGPPPVVTTYIAQDVPAAPVTAEVNEWVGISDASISSIVPAQSIYSPPPQAYAASDRGVPAGAYIPQTAPWPEPQIQAVGFSIGSEPVRLDPGHSSPSPAQLPPEPPTG